MRRKLVMGESLFVHKNDTVNGCRVNFQEIIFAVFNLLTLSLIMTDEY